jgi:sporulation protein YlmC with PRC-barrel domain
MEEFFMDIEYGTEVIDREGNALGTIDRVIRDSWTGEIRKFSVNQDAPGNELMFSPEEILVQDENKIKIDVSQDDLRKS